MKVKLLDECTNPNEQRVFAFGRVKLARDCLAGGLYTAARRCKPPRIFAKDALHRGLRNRVYDEGEVVARIPKEVIERVQEALDEAVGCLGDDLWEEDDFMVRIPAAGVQGPTEILW
jgi:hypothetical protein